MEKTLKQAASRCLKIVLFGPESTGKTTLAKQLAAHFDTQWVPEYMRTYLEHKWETTHKRIEKKDVLPIVVGQMVNENAISKLVDTVLFLDTNLLEIKVYCEYYYKGWCPSEIANSALEGHYDHYFLTGIDIPWVNDNLRDRPDDREEMFRIFETELIQNELPYTVLQGSKLDRLTNAINIINTLIKQK
jgi:NadR type nicotinamide-nucleotide adenylyltransferase